MSGGIAYVYDVRGSFTKNCNQDMVDLDQLTAADAVELHDMIGRHYAYTGSMVAKFVLDDFENQARQFIKVYPRDYKRVMERSENVKVKMKNEK